LELPVFAVWRKHTSFDGRFQNKATQTGSRNAYVVTSGCMSWGASLTDIGEDVENALCEMPAVNTDAQERNRLLAEAPQQVRTFYDAIKYISGEVLGSLQFQTASLQ
jgi:hypothetical protein